MGEWEERGRVLRVGKSPHIKSCVGLDMSTLYFFALLYSKQAFKICSYVGVNLVALVFKTWQKRHFFLQNKVRIQHEKLLKSKAFLINHLNFQRIFPYFVFDKCWGIWLRSDNISGIGWLSGVQENWLFWKHSKLTRWQKKRHIF